MHINDILRIQGVKERDKALRQAFASYHQFPITDDAELTTLIVLLNLSLKRENVDDLCDETKALKLLKDSTHLQHCIKTTEWFHTHNLKYPDARVSKQRLICDSPKLILGIITSAGQPKLFGWSHNSSDINYAKLFNAAFIYRNEKTNLALVLLNKMEPWLLALRHLGASQQKVVNLCNAIRAHANFATSLPDEIHDISKQVRFPWASNYVSITPVVSHSLQVQLHQLAFEGAFRTTKIKHAHPASVGGFVGSLGGHISALYYPPEIRRTKPQTFFDAQEIKLSTGKQLFDESVFFDRYFLNSLEHILYPNGITKKQKQHYKHSALLYLKRCLAIWLSPIFELRDDIEEKKVKMNVAGYHRLTAKLLQTPKSELQALSNELTAEFHRCLQKRTATRKYAFHTRLLSPVNRQLNVILKLLSELDEKAVSADHSYGYLHLSNLHVYNASAMANPYLCSLPSLTALAGFCHDYQRRINQLGENKLQFCEFAWFISEYHAVAGKSLPEPSIPQKDKEISNISRPGVIDSKHCDLTMDLVIKIINIDSTSHISHLSSELFQAGLPSKFAGGSLHPPSLYESARTRWCELYTDMNELYSRLARLPPQGCWVYPYASNITSLNELSVLLKDKPTLKPVSIGYIGLEEPRERNNSIEPLHMYAETAVGLAQCINAIDIRYQGERMSV